MNEPSATARRVDAYRMTFDRLEAPYGDGTGDDLLFQDVAGDTGVDSSQPMGVYLRYHTGLPWPTGPNG
jgi:hypothetical protein